MSTTAIRPRPPGETCLSQMSAIWAIRPEVAAAALAAWRAGRFQPFAGPADFDGESDRYAVDANGIASIFISGTMTKHGSPTFGGTSTLRVRRQVREATNDKRVKGILLRIDSPGGEVAGTEQLAAAVRRAMLLKPVHVLGEDDVSSAAYWVASQADTITVTPSTLTGSVGTYTIVEDWSKAAEAEGVVVHVIASAGAEAYKGGGVPGAPVSERYLKYVQRTVDDVNGLFLKGIMLGRLLSESDVRELADGRVHIASKAKQLGLVDEIGGFDMAYDRLLAAIPSGEGGRPNLARANRMIAAAEAQPVWAGPPVPLTAAQRAEQQAVLAKLDTEVAVLEGRVSRPQPEPPPISDADLRRMAYHEAGHAVCCEALGVRVDRVSLDACEHARIHDPTKRCAVLLSGGMAARMYADGDRPGADRDDLRRINALGNEGHLLPKARLLAQETLRGRERSVRRVVKRLAERGELSGDEVRRTIAGLPEPGW